MYKKAGISKSMWWAFSFSKCLLFFFFFFSFLERGFEITETREFVLILQINCPRLVLFYIPNHKRHTPLPHPQQRV
jgi:hypothetical protein